MVFNFLFETFTLGLKNIRLHKLRSLLTTLGIIFGVAAVIIMVAIGEGTKQAALDQLRQLGAKNILIRSVPPPETNEATSRNTRVLDYGIRRLDHRRLQSLPGLAHIVPLRDTQQKVVFGDRRVPANAIGTVPEMFDVVSLHLERGRSFNQIDLERQTAVCVLGNLAAQQLFPYQDPLGQRIQIGGSTGGLVVLEVIGVLEKTGLRPGTGFINRELDQDIYFPLTLAQTTFGDTIVKNTAGSQERKSIELTEVWLQANEGVDVEQLASIVDNLVKLNHEKKDYEVKVPIEILRNAERLNRMFNFIMVGIASFSLVVGGIGIMNIMLASVTERTREIGIRRALGAKRRHITLQFLIETTVVSLAGGLIGIGLGSGGAVALPHIVHFFNSDQNYPTQLASWSIIGSFIVSGLIGIGFGLYPAITAARMNPIEALRHE
ncbi:MAG TPA: ABC transporter permease [Tepidisphaeraceae bacterium]|nr:ABC transporter permease [Tepidisphaeraceae bacterium]